jgi:ABC-type multidrug transport system fused ATPase/permease subunit
MTRTRNVVAFVALVLVGVALENVGIGLLIPLIDALNNNTSPSVRVAGNVVRLGLGTGVVILASAIILRAGIQLLTLYISSRVANSSADTVRTELHARIYDPQDSAIAEIRTGEYLNILTGETWRSGEYRRAQLDLVARSTSAIAFGAVLLYISWKMSLVLLAAGIPFGVIGRVVNQRTRRLGRTLVAQHNALHDTAVASLDGRFTITAFGLAPRFISKFNAQSQEIRDVTLRADVMGAALPQLLPVMMIPVLMGVVLIGRSIGLPVSWIVAYAVVLYRAVPAVTGSMGALAELHRQQGGHEAVQRVLDIPMPVGGENRRIDETIDHIELCNVSFGYGAAAPIIRNMSALLTKGNIYQLHGQSGAGKSTLLSLILGLLRPTSGVVTLNDIPLDRIDHLSYWSKVGYAGQQSSIFEESIDWNLYLDGDYDDERKRQIEVDFGIREILDRLPAGRATPIGRKGLGLSGGELQRLQLARAAVRNPMLLILDEATSELDRAAEQRTLWAVRKHCPEAMLLVISHRGVAYAEPGLTTIVELDDLSSAVVAPISPPAGEPSNQTGPPMS